MSKGPTLYIAPSSTLGLGARAYEVRWHADANADDFTLHSLETVVDAAGDISFRATVRRPPAALPPLLTIELLAGGRQPGFRVGGDADPIADMVLQGLLGDAYGWDSDQQRLIGFEEWSAPGKQAWQFIADMLSRTTPPTPQAAILLHAPKQAVLGQASAEISRGLKVLSPSRVLERDSLPSAATELTSLLGLAFAADMVSVWNSGFSRPRLLALRAERAIERLAHLGERHGVRTVNVASEKELPVW